MLTVDEMFQNVVNTNSNLNRDTVREVCTILFNFISMQEKVSKTKENQNEKH